LKVKIGRMKSNTPVYCSIDTSGYIEASLSQIKIESLSRRLVSEQSFPHRHDFYTIMIINNGSGWHEIDCHRHEVKANQVFMIKPGQVHTWQLNEDIEGYIVEFKREVLDLNIPICSEMINYFHSSNDIMSVDARTLRYLNSICVIMYEEILERKEGYDICLQSFIASLLVLIMRLTDAKRVRRFVPQDLSESFLELVNRYYTREHGVDFYAKQLGVSVKALTSIIRRVRTKSPRQLIQQRFLIEAKRLLTYSELSVAEIGYAVGFEDPNYFSRFFRSQEQMSPAEFRNKNQRMKTTEQRRD
jgi:AraC family transcriptional activator of pobA